MTPDLGLKATARAAEADMLNRLLSDEVILHTKTKRFHWNVTGPHFRDLHLLFDTQAAELQEAIDDVAERVRALGFPALGTLRGFAAQSRLPESDGADPAALGMVAELLKDHETVIRRLRADVETCATRHGDQGTSDFLTGLMEAHEKTAWMLRATLEGAAGPSPKNRAKR